MKNFFLLVSLTLFCGILNSQATIYLSPGITLGYSKANLSRLQKSYDSYISYAKNTYSGDDFDAPKNWSSSSFTPGLSFHAGASGDGICFSISYFGYKLKQTRNIIRESGYGRRFVWKENRNEILFDIGYGSNKFDVFASFGVNSNNYKMSSYQIYPSGAESINNEFNFNGNYRVYDAGISYGAGIKIKPTKYLAIDLRLIRAGDQLIGEGKNVDITGEGTAVTDNTIARTPGTSQYPEDYTEPLDLENEIIPNFSRLYVQASFLFYIRLN